MEKTPAEHLKSCLEQEKNALFIHNFIASKPNKSEMSSLVLS